MIYDESVIPQRIKAFKADLGIKTTEYMIRKYTTFGDAYIMDANNYFDLRSEIADHFEIHPSEVIMVGSGKLGFSIKPSKRYIPFGENSDIDMAIISPILFDQIWQQSLDYFLTGASWYYKNASKFKEYLFLGWLRPDKLPSSRNFREIQDWRDFFVDLTHKYKSPKIAGGLYKSWYHFELYQSRAVNDCKQEMELAGD